MKINKDNFNYYGFDIEKVKEKIEGDLTYLGTFCIFGQYKPVAVFANANPNLEKAHKPFCYLVASGKQIMIGGIDEKQMEIERYQDGIKCNKCEDVIYSVMRHDFRRCKCGTVVIDGGKDYTKISGNKEEYTLVKIDFLTGEVV